MRNALGAVAAQAGSLNAPGRLRFDFTSPAGAVAPAALDRDRGRGQLACSRRTARSRAYDTSMDEARRIGAMMLFGEKYGDRVRVVDIGDYSRELCGGTHVGRTGQIGLIKLLSEASIGSGVRRVEALVGLDAFRYLVPRAPAGVQLAEQFKARPRTCRSGSAALVERLRTAERDLEKVRADAVLASAGALADGRRGRRRHRAGRRGRAGRGGRQRPAGAGLRRARPARRPARAWSRCSPPTAGKVSFVVATTAAARDRGLAAGKLVRRSPPAVGGRGGGKPDLAQGGGTDPSGVPAAIDALRAALRG